MSNEYAYRADQELPSIGLDWRDRDGNLIDYSTGWTFTVKFTSTEDTTIIGTPKTTGITGAATSPNVVIDWSTSDWSSLTASATGTKYKLHLYARRTADSKDDVFAPNDPPRIVLYSAPAA